MIKQSKKNQYFSIDSADLVTFTKYIFQNKFCSFVVYLLYCIYIPIMINVSACMAEKLSIIKTQLAKMAVTQKYGNSVSL